MSPTPCFLFLLADLVSVPGNRSGDGFICMVFFYKRIVFVHACMSFSLKLKIFYAYYFINSFFCLVMSNSTVYNMEILICGLSL